MLPLSEARRRILESVAPLGAETIPLAEAEGRFLSLEIKAPVDLPGFHTAAVDGYALRSEEIRFASPETPVFLPVEARLAAGQPATGSLTRFACQRLFTGAMIPEGADSVVMQEDTVAPPENPGVVGITSATTPFENFRFRGEDVRAGTVVASRGERATFGTIALLSALGLREIEVFRRPSVAILATGAELTEGGRSLEAGMIYESNRAMLACLARKAGGAPTAPRPIVSDHLDAICLALEDAFKLADVVVTVGGVSVGDHDLVRPAFSRLGGEIEFWRVAVRPGKPFVFGRWKGKWLFGLPGNPVSAAVCFWILAGPALLGLQGAGDPGPRGLRLPLGEAIYNRGDRPHFFRVKLGQDGRLVSAGTQAAHILGAMAASNGLVELGPGEKKSPGDVVTFLPWS
jgi:molybdopterin molybdotransferase